jgi:hypothetical protein
VPAVRDLADRRLDVIPTLLVVERAPDDLGDERTAAPGAYAPVELRDEIVVESYVHSHGRNLAHSDSHSPGAALSEEPPGDHSEAIEVVHVVSEERHPNDLSVTYPSSQVGDVMLLPR